MDEGMVTDGQAPVEQSQGTEQVTQDTPNQGQETQQGSWPKEFQAEFTRWRQQETARAEQERQAWTQKEQQYQQVVQQLVQRMQQAAKPQQQQDPFAAVKDMPYVDGQTMAQLLQQVQQGYQPVQSQVQQLAATMNLLAKENAGLKQQLGGIQGESQTAKTENRFNTVRTSLGMPDNPTTRQILEDVFYSHEWNGLEDQEFQRYVQERWDGLKKLIREADKAEAMKARQMPFTRKGGDAQPSKPAQGFATKSADELGEELALQLGLK